MRSFGAAQTWMGRNERYCTEEDVMTSNIEGICSWVLRL